MKTKHTITGRIVREPRLRQLVSSTNDKARSRSQLLGCDYGALELRLAAMLLNSKG